MIEGTDATLKRTYVMFGAHLDHIGYSQVGAGVLPTASSCRARSDVAQAAVKAAGKVVQNPGRGRGAPPAAAAPGGSGATGTTAPPPIPFEQRDLVNNGADDDGSGSTALMAIAKAFATGPKPKRSVVFVWHAGEEAGLHGSRYNADFSGRSARQGAGACSTWTWSAATTATTLEGRLHELGVRRRRRSDQHRPAQSDRQRQRRDSPGR